MSTTHTSRKGVRAHGIHRRRVGVGLGATTSSDDHSPTRDRGTPKRSRRGLPREMTEAMTEPEPHAGRD